MLSYKTLSTLLLSLSLTLATADVSLPDDATMCLGQGSGNCQFSVYNIWHSDPGPVCDRSKPLIEQRAIIFDHACNQIGSSDSANEGDSIPSELPYTVDIANADQAWTAECHMKYAIKYSDGEYGWGMPKQGAWDTCKSDKGYCTYYRVAFPC